MDSLNKAVYVSEQVCIRWRNTDAYYTAKLTFSHQSLGCVLYKCAYYIRLFTVLVADFCSTKECKVDVVEVTHSQLIVLSTRDLSSLI